MEAAKSAGSFVELLFSFRLKILIQQLDVLSFRGEVPGMSSS